jgi:hypothetical protein
MIYRKDLVSTRYNQYIGPAAYNLPPTIGNYSKAAKGVKAPAYSFGIKLLDERKGI